MPHPVGSRLHAARTSQSHTCVWAHLQQKFATDINANPEQTLSSSSTFSRAAATAAMAYTLWCPSGGAAAASSAAASAPLIRKVQLLACSPCAAAGGACCSASTAECRAAAVGATGVDAARSAHSASASRLDSTPVLGATPLPYTTAKLEQMPCFYMSVSADTMITSCLVGSCYAEGQG
jgi:hypothetical protein